MNIKIKDFNRRAFNNFYEKFTEDTIRRVSDPTYEHYYFSFMFKKKHYQFAKFFADDNIKKNLYSFFGESFSSNNDDFFELWDRNYSKLDRFMLEVVKSDPKAFLKDTRLAVYSRRFLVKDIFTKAFLDNYSVKAYYIDNTLSNYVIINTSSSIFDLATNIEYTSIFNDSFLETKFSVRNQRFLFGKDIIAEVVKAIKQGAILKDLDPSSFMSNKTELIDSNLNFYLDTAKEIVLSGSYMRNRRSINYKTVTKRTFPHFISTYFKFLLSDTHYQRKNIFSFLKENNLKFKDFRISGNEEAKYILGNLSSFLMGTSSQYPESVYKNFGDKLLYLDSKSLLIRQNMNRLCFSESKFTISKNLNPTKLKFQTKKLLFKNEKSIHLLFSLTNRFDNKSKARVLTLISTIKNLAAAGVTEKAIRGFFSKFFNMDKFIEKVDSHNKEIYQFNNQLLHNVFITLFNELNSFSKLIKNFPNRGLISSFFSLLSKLNNDISSVDMISKYLSKFRLSFEVLKTIENTRFLSLKDFDSVLLKLEALKLEQEILFYKKNLNITQESIDYSLLMNCHKSHLKLLAGIYDKKRDTYFSPNKLVNFPVITKDKYTVGIYPHNCSMGLLGANVKGVCISSYGGHRLSQITPDFANLIVFNKHSGIMLWGLLCRAENKSGEVIYILNNLQGSPSKSFTEDIIKDIKFLFKEVCETNGLKNLLYKNHGFNAATIESEYTENIKKTNFKLNDEIRLDFYLENNSFCKALPFKIAS